MAKPHSPGISKNTIGLSTLVAAAFSFLMLLPDLDGFAAEFSVAPQLLGNLFTIDDLRLQTLYGKLGCVLLAGTSVLGFGALLRNSRLKLFLAGTAILLVYCWTLMLMNGMGFGAVLRSPSLIGIYLMVLTTTAFCGLAKNPQIQRGIGFGILAAGGIRLLYALYCFRRYGGIQIFEGTPALAMDGGLLILWAVIASWAGLQIFQSVYQRRFGRGFFMLLILTVFTAAVAASFRRTVMLLLLGNLGLAAVLYSWFRNRLAAGIVWVSGMSIGVVAALFLVMAAVFGFTTASERVFSLTSTNKSNSFGNSNEAYLDDQAALIDSLKGSGFLGVGPGLPYGVTRVSDDFSNEGIVPLHTGTSELWASAGVVGLLYHLVILLGLPVICLRTYRRSPMGDEQAVAAVAVSYSIFINIWPFIPPFYYNNQGSVIAGLCFGYLIHAANEAGVRTRGSRAAVAPPFVRARRIAV